MLYFCFIVYDFAYTFRSIPCCRYLQMYSDSTPFFSSPLTNLVVCIQVRGPRVHTSNNLMKQHSYIVEFMLRVLMKVNLSQTTRSHNLNGQNFWVFLRTDLMALLLVHSVPSSPFYKYSQKAPLDRWDHGAPHLQPAGGAHLAQSMCNLRKQPSKKE